MRVRAGLRRVHEWCEPGGLPHVVQQADAPDQVAVQYWFYWYYNDWNNKHESPFWHLSSDEHDQAFAGAVELVRQRLPALVATVLRALLIFVALAVTIVGIPWAIRQAVRYQFIVPLVATPAILLYGDAAAEHAPQGNGQVTAAVGTH